MGLRSSLLHRLELRWHLRRTRALGMPAFGSRLDHTIVVPPGIDGRPGYRLTATAPSSGLRKPSTGRSTSDFFLKYSPRSHLVGVCWGPAEPGDLTDRTVEEIDRLVAVRPGTACVHRPSATTFAGAPAVTYTLDVGGLHVTDWVFERAGWSFVVGRYHHPDDGLEELATADRILGSWAWLADSEARER